MQAPGNARREEKQQRKAETGWSLRRPRTRGPSTAELPTHATYLSFAGSWFIQQESVRVGLESIISLGRAKGVPQILGAGLGVGGRGGGDATAPAPVPAGGAAAAVRHVAALLPRVTGRAGSWAETRQDAQGPVPGSTPDSARTAQGRGQETLVWSLGSRI